MRDTDIGGTLERGIRAQGEFCSEGYERPGVSVVGDAGIGGIL